MTKKKNTTYPLNKVDYCIFIIFSIGAFFMLYLFYRDMNSLSVKQSEEPIAKIYFKKNIAQRKFIDSDIWEILTESSNIYDGDRIRTSSNSEAYTEFREGNIQIQIHEKSMIQINKSIDGKKVDFIGGEILVTNNSVQEPLIINSSQKKVAVTPSSKVKLQVTKKEDDIDIQVLKGKAEVSNQEDDTKEPVILYATKEMDSNSPSEEIPKQEDDKKEVVATTKEKEVTHSPVKEEQVSSPEPTTPQVIKVGMQKGKEEKTAVFAKRTYDRKKGLYNYAYPFKFSEATQRNAIIPAGSLIEVTTSGVPDHSFQSFALQISTGEKNWIRAHSFNYTIPNNGKGFTKGQPFKEKRTIILTRDIVNTNGVSAEFCYEPRILDQVVIINDFKISINVLSTNGGIKAKQIKSGFTKTLEYGKITLTKEIWGSGERDFNYSLMLNAHSIFQDIVYIPSGTKIKISVSGKCNQMIKWFRPDLIYDSGNNWNYVFMKKGSEDWHSLFFTDDSIESNQAFNYTKVYTVHQDFKNSNDGLFYLTFSNEGMGKKPTLTDLKIVITVL